MGKGISRQKRIMVANKYHWHCAYCGVKLSTDTLVIDHIIPRASGGNNDVNNLFPSCHKCNSSKGTKTVEQFRLYLSFKKVIKQPDFNQSQIEFLEKKGVLKNLNIINNHIFFFERPEVRNAI